MTDMTRFERRVAILLREIADGAPGTDDGAAMARIAMTSPAVRLPWLRQLSRSRPLVLVSGVLALLMALVTGTLLSGSPPTLPSVEATTEPTPHPTYRLIYAPPSPPIPQPTGKIGFIGLPPEGVGPSSPETGALVLAYVSPRPWHWVNVYRDGRFIWTSEEGVAFGANEATSGVLEQRLTPLGVDLLVNEALATGLFDVDREFPGGRFGNLRLWNGTRFVGFGAGLRPEIARTNPTGEQRQALERLHSILTEPTSWFPASAWQDREIRAFVPSRYSVCLGPDEMVALPSDAQDVLQSAIPIVGRSIGGIFPMTNDGICRELPTEAARDLGAMLEAAGLRRGELVTTLSYEVTIGSGHGSVNFDPILPDGSLTCLGCG